MWKVRGIRGATTASENSVESMRDAVLELLEAIENRNHLDFDDVVSVIFTATSDLDAIFPAAIARERDGWGNVPLLDLQQMAVKGSLERCIRVLIYVNSELPQEAMNHLYLRNAEKLRPDLSFAHLGLSGQTRHLS